MLRSVQNLFAGLIDYAGLFPPANLDLAAALQKYEHYRTGEYAWMLGPFVISASGLRELSGPLPVRVVAGNNLGQDVACVQDFARSYPGSVEAIEIKVATVAEIRTAAEQVPSEIPIFFEVPIANNSATLVAAIAEEGACAKIRTGGLSADAIPTAAELVRFLEICSIAVVPFKATAGLHHPLRGVRALTNDPNSPSAPMHGFVNVFLAAAFIRSHIARSAALALIEEDSTEAFQFDEKSLSWREHKLTSEEIAEMRANFAVSFGSCSFEEPIAELRAMGLL